MAAGSSYPAITVTVNVAANAASPQVNSVSVSGGGSATANGNDSTTIMAPDFTISLSAPIPATVIAGSPATYTVTVAPVSGSGFIGNVGLAAQGLPAGATASFSSATVSGGSGTSTMTVTSPVSLTAAAVMGTSGTLSHMAAAQGVLTVQDFTLTVMPSSSSASPWVVTAGQTLNFTVTATGVNGFSEPINVSLGLLGSSYFEGALTPGAPLNFSGVVPPNTAGGAQSYSVLGQYGGLSHSVTGQLSIAAQNYSISVVQTNLQQALSSPGSAGFTMTLASINGFTGTVSFASISNAGWSVAGFPNSGVTLTANETWTGPLTVTFPAGLAADQAIMEINSKSLYSNLVSIYQSSFTTVTFGSSPGSALSISSTHAGSFSVGQSGSYTVSVTNQTGGAPTSGSVSVTDALPAGLTLASISGTGWACTGSSCSRSDALNGGFSYPPITALVSVGLNAPSQVVNQVSVAYTVGGNPLSASGADTTAIQGSASPPDFTITALQNPQTVAPGGSATYSISVNPLGSFGSSAVSLSMGAIAGVSASVSPSAQSGGPATLTVSTFSSTSLGTIPILITGISGATTHYAVANLKVAPAAPAAITTPPPGRFIPGGATLFTWNSGNGASQYRLTAGSTPGGANYPVTTISAQTASVNLPSTLGQTVYLTMSSSTPAGVALTPQTYAYTIGTAGTTQPIAGLTLVANQPAAKVNNNGVEVAYTYNFTGADARAVEECVPSIDTVTARLIQQTASTITIGFTAQAGSRAQSFHVRLRVPDGPARPGRDQRYSAGN